jgi:integrase
MRISEAISLRWIDLDTERKTLKCRPKKRGNPRIFKISNRLTAMLEAFPKKSENIIEYSSTKTAR